MLLFQRTLHQSAAGFITFGIEVVVFLTAFVSVMTVRIVRIVRIG
jgi:hypothetical protein